MSERPTVVMTDVHGHSDLLKQTVDYYGDEALYIMGGDFINKGPDSKGVMDMLGQLDSVLLDGNHEWVMMASLYEADSERRRLFTDDAWLRTPRGRLEENFLASYGIPEYRKAADVQQATRERLEELGHYAMFKSAGLYYEDSEVVVVHAGLDAKESWSHQRAQLDETDDLKKANYFASDVPQIFEHRLSHQVERPSDVKKTLITGHLPRLPDHQRIWRQDSEVSRVMLDNCVSKGNDLLVYECQRREIRAFSLNGEAQLVAVVD